MFDDDAVMPEAPLPPIAPAPAPNDPVAVVELFAVPAEVDPVEDDDPVDNDDVGTLSGSEPTPLVEAVWACAIVMPRAMIAIRTSGRIAFLLHSSPIACDAEQRATAQKVQMKFRKVGGTAVRRRSKRAADVLLPTGKVAQRAAGWRYIIQAV